MPQQRILVAHPSAELYGSDRVLLESVAGFVGNGADVEVLLATSGPLEQQLTARGARVRIVPMPVVRKSVLKPRGFVGFVSRSVVGLVSGLALVRRSRPSAIYVSTLTIPLWNLIARLSGTPLVVHVHEAERSAGRALRYALAAPLRLASLVVFNSIYARDTVQLTSPTAASTSRVIYNGVVGPETVVEARASLNRELRLVYVGRLSARKGPDVLVEAIARARHADMVTLVIVGAVFPGYEWFEQQLRTRIAELGLQSRVRFEGFQPSGYPFLAESDVAVVPSTVDEPFGNTAVEAMLAARPAIVSDTSGLREAGAGYSSVVFVEPGDADSLAHAIDRMVDEWQVMRDGAAADARAAASRHSIETYQGEIWQAVAQVIPGGEAAPILAAASPAAGAKG
ncbi:glycosyltransferase [Agreia sp. VKM Ac-1783]|uniref:glycosyltransferase n=1 Tax=Agreia sp. VKM Ac-1783 TaxID=1938889 RepID=UPI000A2AEE54|nr:glycosyltransferase [Agreia sp. VKM Ac-1783]SMQ58319.1 Glycosyltransferase involved in cell wall bisynthesis [Agreia sp. VKM Ac-1783]